MTTTANTRLADCRRARAMPGNGQHTARRRAEKRIVLAYCQRCHGYSDRYEDAPRCLLMSETWRGRAVCCGPLVVVGRSELDGSSS